MNDLSFDYLWNNIILKSSNEILEIITSEDIVKYEIEFGEEDILKENVHNDYEKSKRILKELYHKKGTKAIIDEHKISSCLCSSIIKNKFFKYKLSKDLPADLFFLNYKIAYYSSVGVLYLFLLSNYKDDEIIFEDLKKRKNIILPETAPSHDPYDICIIKMLLMNDIYQNNFDLLAYSNIMFCLEEYNKAYFSKLHGG